MFYCFSGESAVQLSGLKTVALQIYYRNIFLCIRAYLCIYVLKCIYVF